MKREKARALRWRLAAPLMATFVLLWLGAVAMLFSDSCREVEQTANMVRQETLDALDEYWQTYENNRAKGLGDEAATILRYWLSSAAMGRLEPMDGGMALLARDAETGTVIRSQITWGYGHEEGVDQGQRWYLTFDQGLDREGQLELARWMVANRDGWDYSIYPTDAPGFTEETPDGTYARVTGVEQPGSSVAVQKIEIVHPDGNVETMVETDTPGEADVTLELKFMRVLSVLLPSWSSDGKNGRIHMEQRLDNYLEAQAILDRELAREERVVLNRGGFAAGSTGADGLPLLYVAGQYQTVPYVLRQNWGNYLALLLLTAVAALILSSRQSRKVTRPTEELCAQAAQGRCREDGPVQELNTLAAAFNQAQDKLEGQLERERDFTRSAAHELKTPLAVLRAHAEALREDIAPEKREQYLDVVMEESDRMADLVGSLLELSRLESGTPLQREMVDLSALVGEILAPLRLPLEQKHIVLEQKLEEIWLEGDRERIKEAVGNLASNALRHCVSGGTIRVELCREKGKAQLTVYNDGEAIPAEELPRLWEPFYRGDPSHSRDSGGTGLGLAIVRAAVQAHGGAWGVENRPGGPAFWIALPE